MSFRCVLLIFIGDNVSCACYNLQHADLVSLFVLEMQVMFSFSFLPNIETCNGGFYFWRSFDDTCGACKGGWFARWCVKYCSWHSRKFCLPGSPYPLSLLWIFSQVLAIRHLMNWKTRLLINPLHFQWIYHWRFPLKSIWAGHC